MEFRILGPLEVRDGARAVRTGGPKQRALLGVLLLHANEAVATERLVDELWGADPPATADKLVQGYVHALRKEIGPLVVTEAAGYSLRVDPRDADHLEFERLAEAARRATRPAEASERRRRALSLWRGPPLADVRLEGQARHLVARLEEMRLATELDAIDVELEQGRHDAVVGDVDALAAANPYHERVHSQLMLALYRAGRQADALAVYQRLRRRLVEEFGLDPGEPIRELERAILRQDPTLDVPAARSTDDARTRLRRLTAAAAVVATLLVAAGAAVLLATASDDDGLLLTPRSVGVLDPETNQFEREIPIGTIAAFIVGRGQNVWAVGAGGSVVRIDVRRNRVASTFVVGGTPSGAVLTQRDLWIGDAARNAVMIADTAHDAVRDAIALPSPSKRAEILGSVAPGIAFGGGVVWIAHGHETVRRVHATSGRTLTAVRPARGASTAIAYGNDAAWVAGVNAVTRISAQGDVLGSIRLSATPVALVAADGLVWAALGTAGALARIDVETEAVETLELGGPVTAVVAGRGDVWALVPSRGALIRITAAGDVVATIKTGASPTSVAIIDNRVWVGVK